ncbi:MAG: hypothetical protein RMK01_12600 [Thermomicrobium sp.]|nr:hypothetical protein [Thermomicrobium sp.]MDW8060900.1 hypothetical protein [Thermomicrobium sp.]
MTFDTRDIRVGMDAYTADGVYLGTVRKVVLGPAPPPREPSVAVRHASEVTGELLGPQPTAPLGNPGPETQGARNAFATRRDDALPLGAARFAVGTLPVPLGWRWFRLEDVQVVSFERVVLRRTAAELGVRARVRHAQ